MEDRQGETREAPWRRSGLTPLPVRLLESAASSRRFLEGDSLNKIFRFILSRQNPDGGFRGRGADSDLRCTLFAVATLKAIDYPVPVFKVWRHLRSFGMGNGLDLVDLACLILLRTAFPMLGTTRRRLYKQLERHRGDSAYGLFSKLLAGNAPQGEEGHPVHAALDAPTTRLAAAVLLNCRSGKTIEEALLGRFVEPGGFAPSNKVAKPDLFSTATALFALTSLGADLAAIQKPCLKYVESLWRGSGGFAGHASDEFEDVEQTFHALLAIGCLIRSLSKKYGKQGPGAGTQGATRQWR